MLSLIHPPFILHRGSLDGYAVISPALSNPMPTHIEMLGTFMDSNWGFLTIAFRESLWAFLGPSVSCKLRVPPLKLPHTRLRRKIELGKCPQLQVIAPVPGDINIPGSGLGVLICAWG